MFENKKEKDKIKLINIFIHFKLWISNNLEIKIN